MGKGILFLVVAYLLYLAPNLWYRRRISLDEGSLACLTFDDGPSSVTEPIAEVLHAHRRQGIFFVLGEEVLQRPSTVKDLIEKGQEVGLHGWDHRHGARENPIRRWKNLKRAYRLLEDLGIRPTKYRPPHGITNLTDLWFCKTHGLTMWYWTSLFGDWTAPGEEELYRRLAEYQRSGGVLVLHDGTRDKAVPQGKEGILSVVKRFLEEEDEDEQ